MKEKKLRRILAIVALVFMAIFTVTLIITFVNPKLLNGAFGYAALISGLLGIGLFLIVRFLLKEKQPPEYLPKSNGGENDGKQENGEKVESDKSDDNGGEN